LSFLSNCWLICFSKYLLKHWACWIRVLGKLLISRIRQFAEWHFNYHFAFCRIREIGSRRFPIACNRQAFAWFTYSAVICQVHVFCKILPITRIRQFHQLGVTYTLLLLLYTSSKGWPAGDYYMCKFNVAVGQLFACLFCTGTIC
jgi:hypothetical protein